MKTSLAAVATFAGLLLTPLAQAQLQSFTALLAPEVTGATGSGSVTVQYDADAHTLWIDADWAGLSGTTTVAHIHCCVATPFTGTVGVAVTPSTLPGFPSGLSAGSYTTLPALDLTNTATYTSAFRSANGNTAAGAEAALLTGLYSGTAYFNIHSSSFTSGEIRGFLVPVPEPASVALMLAGLAAVAGWARRRRI